MVGTARAQSSILVASRSGGVGKTLLIQALRAVLAAPDGAPSWRVASVGVPGADEKSGLARIMADCQDFWSPSLLDGVSANQWPVHEFCDRVMDAIAEGGLLIDFSADVMTLFAEWLPWMENGVTKLGGCPPSVLLVPTVGSPQAINEAVATVREFRLAPTILPLARVVVVVNELRGAIEKPLSADHAWLLAEAQARRLALMRMPRCDSALLPACETAGVGLVAALRMSDGELAARFGLVDARRRRAAQVGLADWLAALGVELIGAGVVELAAAA
jgi:hypothetical protein